MGVLKFKDDIIILGQQPWDTDIGSNAKDIAVEFSKHHRVLYVNSPLDRNTIFRSSGDSKVKMRLEVVKGRQPGTMKINHNLWTYYPDCILESINWLNDGYLFEYFNRVNNKRFAASIKKAICQLKFSGYHLINDGEIFKGFYQKEYLQPATSIYYLRDYMLGVDYWKKHGVKFEPALIAKSDLCITNSDYLENYCKQYNHNSYNVGQGFNFHTFKPGKLPDSLAKDKSYKDTIGYVGALNSARLDIDLLAFLALNFPNINFILVGEEDKAFQRSKLHNLENVTFLGQKRMEDLPSLINSFSICINPQLHNEITDGNYPRKIDEYLAAGKAIVATKTHAMESFSGYVYLAENGEHFLSLIRKLLMEDQQPYVARRKKKAFENSWSRSVNKISGLIQLTMDTQ